MSANILSKEDQALEALIKIVHDIKQGNSVSPQTMQYAEDAIKKNGYEVKTINSFIEGFSYVFIEKSEGDKDIMKLFAFAPDGNGQSSFVVAAENQEIATSLVDAHINNVVRKRYLGKYETEGWGTDYYKCESMPLDIVLEFPYS